MKKKILIAVLWVLVIGVLFSLMPWSKNISVQTTAYEYALDQEEALRTHEVTIEGKYFYGIWREPYFDGTFAFSGFPFSQEQSARIHFRREYGNLANLIYRDEAGQPYTSALGQLRCERDFSEFVILVYETERTGDQITSTWNPETGHVLCTNAPDYAALREQCEVLGFNIWEGA